MYTITSLTDYVASLPVSGASSEAEIFREAGYPVGKASSPGSRSNCWERGTKERAWYTLFAHVLIILVIVYALSYYIGGIHHGCVQKINTKICKKCIGEPAGSTDMPGMLQCTPLQAIVTLAKL